MKKALKILGALTAAVALALLVFMFYVIIKGMPYYGVAVPAPALAAPESGRPLTSAQLAPGEKLVVSNCTGCHLNRQTHSLSGYVLTETPREFGTLYAANITQDKQHGIGAWTDAEVVTVLRTGIGRDGRYRLAMPNLANMSDEDVRSIVGFLRSNHSLVKPVPTLARPQEPSLLIIVLAHPVMNPLSLPQAPILALSQANVLAYGWYLVVGRYLCYECHSANLGTNNPLEPEKSKGYLGGGTARANEQRQVVLTRNLTPDAGTGIGDWTLGQFAQAIRFGKSPNEALHAPMPKYSRLSDQEMGAIFAYLQTVPAIRHATPKDGRVSILE